VTPGGRRGAGNPRRPPRTCRQPARALAGSGRSVAAGGGGRRRI